MYIKFLFGTSKFKILSYAGISVKGAFRLFLFRFCFSQKRGIAVNRVLRKIFLNRAACGILYEHCQSRLK